LTLNCAWRLGAIEALVAMHRCEISACDLLEAHLTRIDEVDPALHSFLTLCGTRAREEARASDMRRDAGLPLRPLEGLPFAVKDLTDTAGVRTTYGSLPFRDHVPERDELCIARLRNAGAILVGKTNTPEFGFGLRSVNRLAASTANPHDLSLSAGGSSGGSAAAVAAGLVPLAHGTDFGGSVRTPAAFCGIVGLRPTPGRIPSASRSLAWNALSTHGILTRSADDAALMFSVMSGHDPRDPLSRPGPAFPARIGEAVSADLKIGASHNLGVAPMSAAVHASFDGAVGEIARRFPSIESAAPDCRGGPEAFGVLRGAQVRRQFRPLAEKHPDELTPSLLWNIQQGEALTADDLLAAEEVRSRIYAAFLRFFERFDALLTPSASVPPFPNTQQEVLEIDSAALESRIDYLAITFLISLVGLPSITIPFWAPGAALPVGLQVVAPPWREDLLLTIARDLEADEAFRCRWPSAFGEPVPNG
jgi:amidase